MKRTTERSDVLSALEKYLLFTDRGANHCALELAINEIKRLRAYCVAKEKEQEVNQWKETVRAIYDIMHGKYPYCTKQSIIELIENNHKDFFCVFKTWEEIEKEKTIL